MIAAASPTAAMTTATALTAITAIIVMMETKMIATATITITTTITMTMTTATTKAMTTTNTTNLQIHMYIVVMQWVQTQMFYDGYLNSNAAVLSKCVYTQLSTLVYSAMSWVCGRMLDMPNFASFF